LAIACEIPPESIKHTPPWLMELEVKAHDVARIYSAFDVLASPSYGEGFGVPIIEAQACGVPVIVNNWTAMPELCGAGWLADGDRYWDGTQNSWFKYATVDSIHDAFEKAYEARDDKELRARARTFALDYDADRVMRDYWTPVLEELTADTVPSVPEVEVLRRPNRAERRAAKRAAA
jgi:glycosyltransferase involved in cell wall biosynthesis